jgi:hypothetical protein
MNAGERKSPRRPGGGCSWLMSGCSSAAMTSVPTSSSLSALRISAQYGGGGAALPHAGITNASLGVVPLLEANASSATRRRPRLTPHCALDTFLIYGETEERPVVSGAYEPYQRQVRKQVDGVLESPFENRPRHLKAF